ncbi:MAG: GspH/FimT family pseudopilin [Pseudomonadota bacterium]
MPTSSTEARGDRGLTLLELLVVIAILMIVAVSLPTLSGGAPTHEQTVRAVSSTLVAARAEAVRRARPVRVVFDLAERRYGIVPIEAAEPALEAALAETLPEDITLRLTTAGEVAAPGDRPAILFMPDGSATGATVDLASPGRRSVLSVRWMTGTISRQDAAEAS